MPCIEQERFMKTSGRVTVEREGRTYAASFTVERGMVHVETHTETRTVELGNSTPEKISRQVLNEIIDADLGH
jgi:hypothetical protein